MLITPTMFAPLRRRRHSGPTALRRLLAATMLGGVLALPAPFPAAAQSKDAPNKTASHGKTPAAKPADNKPADGKRAESKQADSKAQDTKSGDSKLAAAKPPAPDAKPAEPKPADAGLLQLGLYPRESDAWWAWETLQRRQPELTNGLTATVAPLDGKSEAGGIVLRANVAAGTDAQRLCRRIVGAGFGCMVVDAPAPSPGPAAPAASKPVAVAAAPAPVPVPPPAPVAVPTVTVPVAAPASPPAAVPAAQSQTVAAQPAPAQPAPQAAPQAAPQTAPNQPTIVTASAASVLAPIGSAVAAPLVPPPAVAKAVAPAEGLIIYSEEDARTMADIEQHSRRKGRLRSVMPDSRLDVMPATLKLENWNLCALTFDDGPHRTVTRQVLEVLNREGVRATYFPVGRVAQNQGDLIRDFIASGHEIGNHSLTHSDLRVMDAEGQRYEIAETNRILRGFGANPVLFRPPYGRYSDELLTIARSEQMNSVLWTVDTRDWKVRNAEKIVQHIKSASGPGSVFLMHSTYASTAQALPQVIAELRAKGCEFVTLSVWLERMRLLALPKIVNAGMPAPGGPAGAPVTATRN